MSDSAKEARPAPSRLELLRGFGELPDEALIDVRTFGAVIDVSETTAWATLARDKGAPRAIPLTARCTRLRVGDVRAYIAGLTMAEAA